MLKVFEIKGKVSFHCIGFSVRCKAVEFTAYLNGASNTDVQV